MNYTKQFRVTPDKSVRISHFDPDSTDKNESKKSALEKIAKLHKRLAELQLHLYAEQKRFEQRLDDPTRRWKISEADYSERGFWDDYEKAYEDVLNKCSTNDAPWFVIPADHKWFRDLAISQIIVETMEKLHISVPEPTIDIDDIRRKYHEAAMEEKTGKRKPEMDTLRTGPKNKNYKL